MAARHEVLAAEATRGRSVGQSTAIGIWLVVAGWTAMALMWATGTASLFGHDQQGLPAAAGVLVFLAGWVVMVAGMMLPSSLPTLTLVDRDECSAGGPRFLIGYFSAWALFGLAGYAGDGVLHVAIDAVPWIASRPHLIVVGAAILAGVAELVGRPAPPRLPSVAASAGAAVLGRAHALDRIRRCWPLMLYAMAIGMDSPAWMVGLTALMGLELAPGAGRVLRAAGAGLVLLAIAVVIHPSVAQAVFGPR